MEYRLRQATGADVDTIATHRYKMFSEMGHGDPELQRSAAPIYMEWLRERLGNGRYQGWLILAPDDSVVAGVGLWLMDWPTGVVDLAPFRGYVFNVWTEPEHRKQGLSRRLMVALLSACKAQGINRVGLHASDAGRNGYEALGFTASNEMTITLQDKDLGR
jgi:GNAT superfamily N-acetyltransferase